jgi:hypothetical protein
MTGGVELHRDAVEFGISSEDQIRETQHDDAIFQIARPLATIRLLTFYRLRLTFSSLLYDNSFNLK